MSFVAIARLNKGIALKAVAAIRNVCPVHHIVPVLRGIGCFNPSTKLTLETVDEDSNVDTNLEDTDDLDNDSDDIENGDAEDDWV